MSCPDLLTPFLWLHSAPLCGCATAYLSSYLLKDILIIKLNAAFGVNISFQLLWTSTKGREIHELMVRVYSVL